MSEINTVEELVDVIYKALDPEGNKEHTKFIIEMLIKDFITKQKEK